MSKSIKITNSTIIDFYAKNPHINIEEINIMFIDILKTLSTDLTKTMENSKLGELHKSISAMKDEIYTIKKDYTEGIHAIFKSNSLENIDKISGLLERNTNSMIDKTSNILNDIIPRTHINQQKQMEVVVRDFHNSISSDTKKLLETVNKDDSTVRSILENVDSKFNSLSNQVNQPLFNFLTASEERMKSDIDQLRESSIVQANEQGKLTHEIMDFLNKYKNSTSTKGSISENMLYELLQNIFPEDEIIDCRSQTASGDFVINRKDTGLPSILIENKDYKLSVDTREVTKFERDVREKKCHGIFLSQSSPITFKELFQVDIKNDLIHVYIPNVGFDQEKVKIAVKIIDNLSPALTAVSEKQNEDDSFHIHIDDIDRIAEEYRAFSIKRIETMDFIKTSHTTMLNNIEELVFPSLQRMLISTGKCMPSDPLTCKYCKIFTGKTKSSLAAHSRKCKSNPKSPLYEPPSEGDVADTPPSPPTMEVELNL